MNDQGRGNISPPRKNIFVWKGGYHGFDKKKFLL